MFKKLTKYKANDIFERGVRVGRHSWNDHHVVLAAGRRRRCWNKPALAAEEDAGTVVSASPNQLARSYPPHYAGIQAVGAHGDEETENSFILEEINEELFAGYGGEEDDNPPITTDQHLQLLDAEARKE